MYITNESVVLYHLKLFYTALYFPPTLPSNRNYVSLDKKPKKNMFPHHFKCNRIEKLMNKKNSRAAAYFLKRLKDRTIFPFYGLKNFPNWAPVRPKEGEGIKAEILVSWSSYLAQRVHMEI